MQEMQKACRQDKDGFKHLTDLIEEAVFLF
jgi:hypothetical protein